MSHMSPDIAEHQFGLDAFRDFEHRGWETLATPYHQVWGHVTGAFVPPLLAALGSIEHRDLLDVATGPGYVARDARKLGATVTAIDFSAAMIRQASRLHPFIRFEVGDAHSLRFPDGSFDAVVSNFGMQHFSDPGRVLSEFARVLRPGGICAFTIWAGNDVNCAGDVLDRALALEAEGQTAVPAGPDYHQLTDADARRGLLRHAGFEECRQASSLATLPWSLNHVDDLFNAEIQGSVRSGARLREQTAEAQARIRTSMAAMIAERFSIEGGGYELPLAAHIVVGRLS
ncbi:methyltransferase family protein [Rhizobium sp. PP-F2F-G36]|nr:methyltransferase family protein [Rhizobium sp. PP-F2F-G36]